MEYVDYQDESMLPDIQKMVSKDLSEPYSIFTYRYFLHNWPSLCICVYDIVNQDENTSNDSLTTNSYESCSTPGNQIKKKKMIANVICKMEMLEDGTHQGYIAMLIVDQSYRNKGIGSKLVYMIIDRMVSQGCNEVVLETEASNQGALGLYTKIGFMKEEKLSRYYLNGGDAFRLKLSIDKIQTQNQGSSESKPNHNS